MTQQTNEQSTATTDEWQQTALGRDAAFIVVEPGRLRGTRFEVGARPRTIGREGDIVFDAVGLSREHAALWAANGAAWIEDRNSTNGTLVNGRLITGRVALKPGDVVALGELEVCLNGGTLTSEASFATSVSDTVGETETTRYLCAATELDEAFCLRLLDEVVDHPYRAPGRSYGVDIPAVARHAIAAQRRWLVRDCALLAVLAVLVGIVLWRLLEARSNDLDWQSAGAVSSHFSWVFVPLVFAWLIVVADLWNRRARVRPRFALGRFDAASVQPRMKARVARRLVEVARAGTGNVTIFSGLDPFVGSGVRVDGWSFAIDVTKGRRNPETGEPAEPRPFDAGDLHAHLAPGLQRLGFPNLNVSERLFVHGIDVASDKRLLPDPMAPPETEVDVAVVREPLRNHQTAARTYLCLEAVGWHGNLVVTMFVRAVRLPGSLFMEASSFVLLPLRHEYYRIDGIRPQSAGEALLGALGSGLVHFLPLLVVSPGRVGAAASRSRDAARRRKDQRWAIAHGKMLDYGTRSTIREDAMRNDTNPYFLLLDQDMYVKVAQERLLDGVSEFLDKHDVDLAEFGAQQTVINQNQTVTYDIRNPSGTGYAIGHQAQGTVQTGATPPQPRR